MGSPRRPLQTHRAESLDFTGECKSKHLFSSKQNPSFPAGPTNQLPVLVLIRRVPPDLRISPPTGISGSTDLADINQAAGNSPKASKNKTLAQIRSILCLNESLNGVLKFGPEKIRGKFSGKKPAQPFR